MQPAAGGGAGSCNRRNSAKGFHIRRKPAIEEAQYIIVIFPFQFPEFFSPDKLPARAHLPSIVNQSHILISPVGCPVLPRHQQLPTHQPPSGLLTVPAIVSTPTVL